MVLLGESLLLNMDKKDLRISRDWLGDQWVNIEAKPDVLSAISSTISSCTRPFVSSNITKDVEDVDCGGNNLLCFKVPSSSTHKKDELDAAASSDLLPEKMDLVNHKKSPSIKDIGTEGVDATYSCGDTQDVQRNDDDDDKDDHTGDDEGREGMEVFETPGKNPKAVEIMEVTS